MVFSITQFALSRPALWIFLIPAALYMLAMVVSLISSTGKKRTSRFDHEVRVMTYEPEHWPSVDVYLPICGEPIEVLRNTWTAVVRADRGASRARCGPTSSTTDRRRKPARRPSRSASAIPPAGPGHRKKAGNLRYAFAQTSDEFLVIFDADFAPRPDFLAETLPYFDDPAIGDRPVAPVLRDSPEADAGSSGPPARSRRCSTGRSSRPGDRFGRGHLRRDLRGLPPVRARAAGRLDADPLRRGRAHRRSTCAGPAGPWCYLPILLSTGICPDNLDAFVRQQYRWCTGNVGIVFSWRLWKIRMSIPARLAYISGFFYYAYTALVTFFGPVIPIVMLAFLPGHVRLRNFVVLLPAMFTGLVLYPLWHRSRFGLGIWPLGVARGWAHVFAIWDGAWGKSMSWHPTRTPGSSLRRFRVGITWWSGSAAVLWFALAVWRTATLGSPQFAVLLFFGLLNLAVVGRVIFPGGRAA